MSGTTSNTRNEGDTPKPQTIGELLALPNPELIPLDLGGSSTNTVPRSKLDFKNLEPWEGFEVYRLKFKELLELRLDDHEVRNSELDPSFRPLKLPELARMYRNEDSFENQILSSTIMPSVNYALQVFAEIKGQPVIFLGREGHSRVDEASQQHPYWALYRNRIAGDKPKKAEDGKSIPKTLMHGDTKLGRKWKLEKGQKVKGKKNTDDFGLEKRKPVKQILQYADEISREFSFIISDEQLVLFQFQKDEGNEQEENDEEENDEEEVTKEMRKLRLRKGKEAAESSTSKSGDYYMARHYIIPWDANGEGEMTVKLGLFMICILAAYDKENPGAKAPRRSQRNVEVA
ncbi:hypothetical protein PGQ11_006427 [Apiospora arundinis]|uniref:Uncharacterized protein n=1 Tax=Apiospora arundinis TaxID=335852 RepID=A0ABR2ITC7_9PEZI